MACDGTDTSSGSGTRTLFISLFCFQNSTFVGQLGVWVSRVFDPCEGRCCPEPITLSTGVCPAGRHGSTAGWVSSRRATLSLPRLAHPFTSQHGALGCRVLSPLLRDSSLPLGVVLGAVIFPGAVPGHALPCSRAQCAGSSSSDSPGPASRLGCLPRSLVSTGSGAQGTRSGGALCAVGVSLLPGLPSGQSGEHVRGVIRSLFCV